MYEDLIDEELKVKLYRDAKRATNILESVYSTLNDRLGENAGDIVDIMPYLIQRIRQDILEGIAILPTE